MKRVSQWFKIGILVGFVWLVTYIATMVVQIFCPKSITDDIIFLYFLLSVDFMGIVTKFFLLSSAMLYMFEQTESWDSQQEKFEFESKSEQY